MFLNRPNWWFFFFVYLCFFKKINTSKIACFSRIRSRIAGVEGEHADHYTTATTALVVVVSQNIASVGVEFTLKFDLKIFWKWRNLLKINIHAGGILSTRKHSILSLGKQAPGRLKSHLGASLRKQELFVREFSWKMMSQQNRRSGELKNRRFPDCNRSKNRKWWLH